MTEIELIDTHCHLQSSGDAMPGQTQTRRLWQKTDLTAAQMINRARAAGVTRLICVGCDPDDSRSAVDFAVSRPQVWASIGIHPHEADRYVADNDVWTKFAALADHPKVVAIGECGLDHFYHHSEPAKQAILLRRQIELATLSDLPLIFHVREAFDEFWPIFDNYRNLRGVLHSFTDNRANLLKALERGLYIGVNGIATFSKSEHQLAVFRSIPLSHLVLETDAPFLTPTPYRGSINESKNVRVIAEFMAKIRNMPLSVLASATTKNARRLFGV